MDKDKFYINYTSTVEKVSTILNDLDNIYNEVLEIINKNINNPATLSIELSKDRTSEIRKYIKKTLSFMDLTYSLNGMKLDFIYNRGKIYNGSSNETKLHLFSAVKFLILSNIELYDELNLIQKQTLIIFFTLKLMLNVNNTITFNLDNLLPIYKPMNKYYINDMVVNIINQLSVENYKIYDLQRETKVLKPNRHKTMQKFTKEILLNHINNFVGTYGKKPTLKELFKHINYSFKRDDFSTQEEYDDAIINNESGLKYYINLFDLKDSMNMKTYKKKDNTKQ